MLLCHKKPSESVNQQGSEKLSLRALVSNGIMAYTIGQVFLTILNSFHGGAEIKYDREEKKRETPIFASATCGSSRDFFYDLQRSRGSLWNSGRYLRSGIPE